MIDESQLIHNKVENTLYVHESFSSMFHGMLDWFSSQFEPRFAYKVISTYDKAVQFFNSKRRSKDGAVQTNILPSITLDPNLDFANEERSGRFLWMFPNLNCLSGRYFSYKVDLKEQGVTISAIHTRYSGTCEVTFWLSSMYELMDFRTKLIQYCGGMNRWIRPQYFWTHIILPKEIVEFNRPTDGKPLDWSATPLEIIQLQTSNSKEYALPYPLNAIWRLDSLSDGSTKYGADQLTEWKIVATFTWECNIPTFLRLDNYSFYDMHPTVNISATPTYASQPLIDRIQVYDSLDRYDLLKNALKNRTIYKLSEKSSPFVKLDNSQCQTFPEFYPGWNHIVYGRLYTRKQLDKMEQFPSDCILLLDTYKEGDIEYLRKSKGCLCQVCDKQTEFYSLISSINLPTICHFSKDLYQALLDCGDQDITMDVISKCLYSEILPVEMVTFTDKIDKKDFEICNNILDNLKDVDNDSLLKRLNFGQEVITRTDKEIELGKYDPKTKTLNLPFLLHESLADRIEVYSNKKFIPKEQYSIHGNLLIFEEKNDCSVYSKIKIKIKGLIKTYNYDLAVDYHMTKEDEMSYYSEGKKIEIEIPEYYNMEKIKCCSYNGMLSETTDFEISDRKVIFNLEPMRNKIIQIFADRNTNS